MFACLYLPHRRSPDAIRAEAGQLAAIAKEFSPRYEQHPPSPSASARQVSPSFATHQASSGVASTGFGGDLVSIDVSGLDRLLGPPRTIGQELVREAAARSLRPHVALAATQTAGMIIAIARPGLTVVPRGGEAAALAAIPIDVLEHIWQPASDFRLRASGLKPEAGSLEPVLKHWGLKTLGELAALPAGDLIARLGRPGRIWQAMARGEDIRPLVPALPEERFDASLELEWPIDGLEPLSFVLTRLLEPLSTRLEQRDRGAAVLHVQLRLVTKEVHARRLELPSPIRDVRTLRTLALLDLESHPPEAAVDGVTVTIDPTPARVLQHTLFTRPHPTPDQLSTLLARLGALMGHDRVGAAATVDSYRPGAFEMRPFATEHRASGSGLRAPDLKPEARSRKPDVTSALRRCRQPVPARVAVEGDRPVRVTTDRRGFAGGTVTRCVGPWRTSGTWWEERLRPCSPEAEESLGRASAKARAGGGAPAPVHKSWLASSWNRDEWDVALSDGAVYRIFRDRDTDAWFIDAIVD